MSRYSGPQKYGSPSLSSSLIETTTGKNLGDCEQDCIGNTACQSWSWKNDECNTFSSSGGIQSDEYLTSNVLAGASAVKYFDPEVKGRPEGTKITPQSVGLTKRGCSVKCVNLDNCVGWSYDNGDLAKYDNTNCSLYSRVSGIDETQTQHATYMMSDYNLQAPIDSTAPDVGIPLSCPPPIACEPQIERAEDDGDTLGDIGAWFENVEWDQVVVGIVLLLVLAFGFWYAFIRRTRYGPRAVERYY